MSEQPTPPGARRSPASDGSHRPLRIGFVGSGFIARFHLQAFESVRDAVITAVYSPTREHREDFAALANATSLGPCRAVASLAELTCADDVDAIWLCGPNDTRVSTVREICDLVTAGRAQLRGLACEKPLARTLAEAQEVLRCTETAGINHGYLENQVFAPAVRRGKDLLWRRAAATAGRPYLARASEEHSGPHSAWFWRGDRQGGGVLLDMMCHSVEVARFLLTAPGTPRESLRPVAAIGMTASLKWSRPHYAEQLSAQLGGEVDYLSAPAEDLANATLTLIDEDGHEVVINATTSWAYVGPGLRIQIEVLGPEYSMEINTLNTALRLFLSREVTGRAGEDMVEKQNAEQGLMPILEDEVATYGYLLEDRHMVHAFRTGQPPAETFRDGVAVVEILMALYRSAEIGQTLRLPADELASYVPPVSRKPEATQKGDRP